MSRRAKARRRAARATPRRLYDFVVARAQGATNTERKPCHWIHGAGEADRLGEVLPGEDIEIDGEGTNFCEECCTTLVEAFEKARPDDADRIGLCVDGGWSTEHDSVPFCGRCGARLEGSLTDYGCEEEVSHWLTYGPPSSPNEWHELFDIIDHVGGYTRGRPDSRSIFAPADPAPEDKLDKRIDARWISVWACVYRCMTRATRNRRRVDEEQERVLREAARRFYIYQVNLRMAQREIAVRLPEADTVLVFLAEPR